MTFGRCAAYAADQDADSTAVGWAESFDSAAAARQVALSEVRLAGWLGLHGPGVGLQRPGGRGGSRSARRRIQQGLRAEGFDPGERTVSSVPERGLGFATGSPARGARGTGYLDGPAATALQSAAATRIQVAEAATAASPQSPSATAVQENLFW